MNPLYYPSQREIARIVKRLERQASDSYLHRASGKDMFREKLRAEARAFMAKHLKFPDPIRFEVIEDGH